MVCAWIDHTYRELRHAAELRVFNPFDASLVACYQEATAREVDAAITSARKAFDDGPWPRMSGTERARALQRLAKLLQNHLQGLAELEIQEAGVTRRKFERMDARLVPEAFHIAAQRAAQDSIREELPAFATGVSASPNYLLRQPWGVCGLITPWNMPLVLAAWKIAPALAAGNCVVIKPSEYTISSTLRLAELAAEAGIPAGVLNVVLGRGPSTGEALLRHRGIDKVSLTGSTQVGHRVQQLTSSRFLPTNLELGGRNVSLVTATDDIEGVARGLLWAAYLHNGQICVAGSWAFVPEEKVSALTVQMVNLMDQLQLGNPALASTDLGPLIHRKHRDHVLNYVNGLMGKGAQLVKGGETPQDPLLSQGAFLTPCLLQGTIQHYQTIQTEVFGPVLTLVPYRCIDEATRAINESPYGLAASVWGQDSDQLTALAERLDVGTVWVNQHHVLSPEYPFVGRRQSGLGTDLGWEGFRSFQKTMRVHLDVTAARDQEAFFYSALLPQVR
jgi:aldehyde dehydrogenase (NAD+)